MSLSALGAKVWRFSRRWLSAFGFIAALQFSATAEAIVYIETESIAVSESVDLESLLDGFQGDRLDASGQRIFSHNEVAIGAKATKWATEWDAAVVGRYDYFADYSTDTAALVFAYANSFDPAPGNYDVDLSLREIQSTGLRFGASSKLSEQFEIGSRIFLFQSRMLTNGRLNGSISLDQNALVSGQADLDYFYQEDLLFNREVNAPKGQGISTDIFARWNATPRLAVNVELEDVWSMIEWNDAPRTVATADTNTARFDPDGLLVVNPVLQSQTTFEDFRQEFHIRSTLRADYRTSDRWSISQTVFNTGDLWLVPTRVEYSLNESWTLSAETEWLNQAFGIGIASEWLSLALTSDSIDISSSQYLHARAAVRFQF